MTHSPAFPTTRLRRLRSTPAMRQLVSEISLRPEKLIQPLFIHHGENIQREIASMPGQKQFSLDQLSSELDGLMQANIRNIILFGIPEHKDHYGSHSLHDDGIIQQAILFIKKNYPEMLVIADVCLCEYTDHGHCGYLDTSNQQQANVDNDRSLILLAKQALSLAQAGADIIAPSANMDGMVQAIRHTLDQHQFKDLPILSYAVKYASNMYGPFREAAMGAPKFGNRKTYQMDFTRIQEALHECELDISEGADMLMVKPAHTYLDVIQRVKTQFPHLPLAAYHTSGEYAMLKAAAQNNWINESLAVLEVLTAIHRAGADCIITYYAKDVGRWLQQANL